MEERGEEGGEETCWVCWDFVAGSAYVSELKMLRAVLMSLSYRSEQHCKISQLPQIQRP